jgi:NTE family protein
MAGPHAARRKDAAGPRIGLALSGGGARGFGHIPVLEALDELGVKPAVIAGTSMGAIIGAGYAAGMSGKDIHDYAIGVFRNGPDVLARLWKLRPKTMREIAGGIATIGQIDVERALKVFLPHFLPQRFDELTIPLKVVATDFYGWREVVLDEGDLILAVAASAAIPMLFRPVMIGDRVLVDGGISNPLPFDRIAGDCDIVVAVDVIGGPVSRDDRLPGPAEAVFGATQLFMQAINREKLRGTVAPHVLVQPATDGFRFMDFRNAAAIIKSSESVKEELKRQLDRAQAAFARSRH